jgi:hypothetical protein
MAPSVFHAYARPTAAPRPRFWSGNQYNDGGKIETENNSRGKHGERAGDELREDEATKRFVRRAQNRRKRFDEMREEHEE